MNRTRRPQSTEPRTNRSERARGVLVLIGLAATATVLLAGCASPVHDFHRVRWSSVQPIASAQPNDRPNDPTHQFARTP